VAETVHPGDPEAGNDAQGGVVVHAPAIFWPEWGG
jgi:hypothetical protein